MAAPESGHRLHILIGNLLRVGVVTATTTVVVGALWYMLSGGAAGAFHTAFQHEPDRLTSVRGIFSGITVGRGAGLIQLGFLLLIATPIARVIFSLIAFVLQRDWMYVFITAVVLAVLGFSLFGG